jgi:hypothetical protein
MEKAPGKTPHRAHSAIPETSASAAARPANREHAGSVYRTLSNQPRSGLRLWDVRSGLGRRRTSISGGSIPAGRLRVDRFAAIPFPAGPFPAEFGTTESAPVRGRIRLIVVGADGRFTAAPESIGGLARGDRSGLGTVQGAVRNSATTPLCVGFPVGILTWAPQPGQNEIKPRIVRRALRCRPHSQTK